MTALTVCALQSDLLWQDPQANRDNFARRMDAGKAADVYVLPEMFATGFSLSGTSIAEEANGPTLQWMRTQAKKHNAAITGSVAVQMGERCYNRMYWVTPDAEPEYYDKRHLFRMAGEHERYAAGQSRKIVTWRGLRFLLQVCYDLRFPVYSRNFTHSPTGDYDVALYVASWPAARRHAWTTLLPARAIENQVYVIGVNRIGEDGRGHHYSGDSAVYDFRGDILAGAEPGSSADLTAVLDLEALQQFRDAFPVGMDADRFTLA